MHMPSVMLAMSLSGWPSSPDPPVSEEANEFQLLAEPLALPFEQFACGDAGIHAALAGGGRSSAWRSARALP